MPSEVWGCRKVEGHDGYYGEEDYCPICRLDDKRKEIESLEASFALADMKICKQRDELKKELKKARDLLGRIYYDSEMRGLMRNADRHSLRSAIGDIVLRYDAQRDYHANSPSKGLGDEGSDEG